MHYIFYQACFSAFILGVYKAFFSYELKPCVSFKKTPNMVQATK